MGIRYKIFWCKTSSPRGYYDEIKDFNDEKHFDNYIAYQGRNEMYKKVVSYEKVYSESLTHSINDVKKAFETTKGKDFNNFEEWYEDYFKKTLN
jgi:hypothetical protein